MLNAISFRNLGKQSILDALQRVAGASNVLSRQPYGWHCSLPRPFQKISLYFCTVLSFVELDYDWYYLLAVQCFDCLVAVGAIRFCKNYYSRPRLRNDVWHECGHGGTQRLRRL